MALCSSIRDLLFWVLTLFTATVFEYPAYLFWTPGLTLSGRGDPRLFERGDTNALWRVTLRRRFGFPRTWQGNTVQKRDATLPGEGLDPGLGKDGHQGGPGRTWTRTCYGSYAAVASASILVSRVASFPPPDGLVSGPPPYLAQTWHSKIGIRDECRK